MAKVGTFRRSKGQRGERGWGVKLDAVFPHLAPWVRTKGGERQPLGDLVPMGGLQMNQMYFIECKAQQCISAKNIEDWLVTVHQQAQVVNSIPLLCVKPTDGPWLIFHGGVQIDRDNARRVGVYLVEV